MRILTVILLFLFVSKASGQYPYVKKLNYPEQLPTQVVYDMLTDTHGYIWFGTDKGLYRFNGRTFVSIPFDNSSSQAVSYLQEDAQGTIWCMNFYNQLFSYTNDTLHKFMIDDKTIRQSATFNNVIVGPQSVRFHSFKNIFEFNKTSRKLERIIKAPSDIDPIVASIEYNKQYYAYSNNGYLLSIRNNAVTWTNMEMPYKEFRFVNGKDHVIGLGTGLEREPVIQVIDEKPVKLPPVDLPADIYIFQAVSTKSNETWLCTQNGLYKWDPKTGDTRCYFPNERVSDIVKDYQGNYWISTLDNGVYVCPSLYNTLTKVYKDPLMDNFTKLAMLPNGELVAGNSQGLMSKLNFETKEVLHYTVPKERETEFIYYDSVASVIISNRGVFKPDQKEPVERVDFSKGIQRDKFGNLVVAVFSGAYVFNDHFGKTDRRPLPACPLYANENMPRVIYGGKHWALLLRQKRSLSVLASRSKDCFWIGYEDGLYQYFYDGRQIILKDEDGQPVIARSMQQLDNGNLIVGTSNKGVIVFEQEKQVKRFDIQTGLSSLNVKKVLKENGFIWILTDAGLDRIDTKNSRVTNYLEEYGLRNTIINDFLVYNGKIIFATTTGILERYNLPKYADFEIKFPFLKGMVNGMEVKDSAELPVNTTDINFSFEALHYLSTTALSYQYRLKGVDTLWRPVGTFLNQLSFNRLSPGNYVFEIKATAGPNYQSVVRSLRFTVPKPFWQKAIFFFLVIWLSCFLLWFSLRQWKRNLLRKQMIKEDLLKSQLVALRAQMNPHFLYNVLNTVQGLVYGNRKTEAGALLGNFSDLMRKTLQASDKQLLSLKDEMENIRLYLELEKARFDEGFSYELTINNIEDLSSIYVPSLMLQPFVENSVKHGLMHKQGEKKLSIRFEKKEEGLSVMVDDNGIGRAHSMEINRRSKNKPFSFATVALNERMDLFNRLYKQKITCRIIDKTDEQKRPSGTRVELFIPDYSNDPRAL